MDAEKENVNIAPQLPQTLETLGIEPVNQPQVPALQQQQQQPPPPVGVPNINLTANQPTPKKKKARRKHYETPINPIKCKHMFKKREEYVQQFFRKKQCFFFSRKSYKHFCFQSPVKRSTVHVVSEDPLVLNVDNTLKQGVQKLFLVGHCQFEIPFDAFCVIYHCGIKYNKRDAKWTDNLFRDSTKTYYTRQLKAVLNTKKFYLEKFPFEFGKIAQKELVLCCTISMGMSGVQMDTWPIHLHFFVKKNNRIENHKYAHKYKVFLDYFIKFMPIVTSFPINYGNNNNGVPKTSHLKPAEMTQVKITELTEEEKEKIQERMKTNSYPQDLIPEDLKCLKKEESQKNMPRITPLSPPVPTITQQSSKGEVSGNRVVRQHVTHVLPSGTDPNNPSRHVTLQQLIDNKSPEVSEDLPEAELPEGVSERSETHNKIPIVHGGSTIRTTGGLLMGVDKKVEGGQQKDGELPMPQLPPQLQDVREIQ